MIIQTELGNWFEEKHILENLKKSIYLKRGKKMKIIELVDQDKKREDVVDDAKDRNDIWRGVNGMTLVSRVAKIMDFLYYNEYVTVGVYLSSKSGRVDRLLSDVEGKRILKYVSMYDKDTRMIKVMANMMRSFEWFLDFNL